MIDAGIVRRVACAKYLLMKGVDTLNAGGPFCAGLAVLSFQDATEMLLGAICEHLHALIKEQTPFNQLLDAIDERGKAKLTHRASLIQLNKARVSFKHHGLEPRNEDAWKFRGNLESFFPTAVDSFFGINYEMVSLTDLVQHTRTRIWLRRADRSLVKDDRLDCVFSCAVALTIAVKRKASNNQRKSIQSHARFEPREDYGALRALVETAKAVDDEFKRTDRDMYLIGSGVKYADLLRFSDLTPHIYFTGDQRPHGNFSHGSDFDENEAQFCLSFAQETILKIQNQYVARNVFSLVRPARQLKVLRSTPVLVYPIGAKHELELEVLTELVADSFVVECKSYGGARGYTPILFEGEVAYVSEQDVAEVEGDPKALIEQNE